MTYNHVCDTTYTHPSFLLFAISVGVTHLTMALLTAARQDLRKLGVPVVRVVTRDGAWSLVIVCTLFAAIVPYSYSLHVEKAHVVFGWPITILSICTVRYTDTDPERTRSRNTDTTIIISEIHTLELEMQEYIYFSHADTVVNSTTN
ncbi:hypothetical protein JR316_0009496 [Psilocybe cubensis]|uniref:Uncharacterized protein n=1 Tax=Psilocybe cubensis TaxID=181762 RepID=A0ACB8GPF6_PSICU|nr:hypothetical protein JR316_0009496 [Psilocybe cubensis]KAH9477292.1 hypothetical protein JR316_0009496 [Psilocybe cubensis]